MADFIKNLLGGQQKPLSAAPSAAHDDDFVDFAHAPDPSPASHAAETPFTAQQPAAASPTLGAGVPRPYTAWYRVWERTQLSDFYVEMFIIPFMLIVVFIHVWGSRTNRRKAKTWATAHVPVLKEEFAHVGYDRYRGSELGGSELESPEGALKEKSLNEFTTYATGRQNVAFVDVKVTLYKRYNPMLILGETLLSFLFDSFAPPEERMEATAYAFDGQEKDVVPTEPDAKLKVGGNSSYDGFVWAVVHKDLMNRLRQDRYDMSLTTTKDHPKLPTWATVMSESAEITDTLLTPELCKAVADAEEVFEAFIISDQPMDKPKTLDQLVPRKRVSLSLRLPSSESYAKFVPLFSYLLRIPDILVQKGHFRPEAMRRVKQTREEEMRVIKRSKENEEAEDRKLKADKDKKEKRDKLISRMTAEEQKKYLDKEREKEMKKGQKRMTMRS